MVHTVPYYVLHSTVHIVPYYVLHSTVHTVPYYVFLFIYLVSSHSTSLNNNACRSYISKLIKIMLVNGDRTRWKSLTLVSRVLVLHNITLIKQIIQSTDLRMTWHNEKAKFPT